MKKKSSIFIVLAFVLVMTALVVLNAKLVFDVTTSQTENIGSIQMENISNKLEKTFSDAQIMVTDVSYEVDLKMNNGATEEDLKNYFTTKKKATKDNNCINVYAAGPGWYIIPDFQAPEGFVATERLWYYGAFKNADSVYITQPYLDLATDGVCFTVSKVLSDGKTVIALDFSLTAVQEYLAEMTENGTAIIVAESGEIAGYSDSSLLGENIYTALPQYSDIFDLEKGNQNSVILTRKINNKSQTIFCSKTENNWYLLLCVENSKLYSSSYTQLIWISVINSCLLIAILVLYGLSRKNQMKTEKQLANKNEDIEEMKKNLHASLKRIVNYSSVEYNSDYESKEENMRTIRQSAIQMTDMVDGMNTTDTSKREVKVKKERKVLQLESINKRIRGAIITVIFIAMFVSVSLVAVSNVRLGNERMNEEAEHYQTELSSWVSEQKSILGMFCNMISADPSILNDYDKAVTLLNDITVEYSDISVTYMTNPNATHTVIMNNGWEPNDDWHVEERQWYIDTLASKTGYSISAPYYDEQTGEYCVTLSQIVEDKDGNFLGIFGIDFYMEKLIKILGESYTKTGYAFLVDSNGNIINHPNAFYEMNLSSVTNVFENEYKNCYADNHTIKTIKDYDNKRKACVSEKDDVSGFTVIVVKDWWNMFGSIFLYSALFIILFGLCIGGIWYLISKLIIWQAQVNEELKDAAAKATSAGKAKSQFLAQMSHEIRTPINAVLGMNELILRESSDDTIREYSNDIQSAGKTLLSLINSILDFSKIEDGKMEIIPVEYDSSSLVNDLVNMTQERSKAKNLEFKLDIDPTIPATLFGDDVRLRQIIVNLLTNSIKYTEHGSVTLKMLVKEKQDGKIKLYVSVVDTGIGIKEEDKDKLCLSFSRLDQERNHAIEGTGLGLSIVTKLLAMMGSELEIESEYGKGSNFFFTIEQEIVKDEPIGDYSSRKQIADASLSNQNYLYAPEASILVVDDNDMNLKVVRGLLKRNGITPDTASSGMECLDMVKNTTYDVILLDHMMPVMDGIETRKQLTERGLITDKTKVIVLTANAIVGAKEMYLEAGFDDYLSKPIDATKLEEKLMEYLPKEKISSKEEELKKEEVKEEATTVEVSEEEKLIDIHIGLGYCCDDMEMYKEIAAAYLEEGASNIEKLDSFYEQEDWKNYAIIAHAVKSTSKTIGAMSLGELAYVHELAGKEGNKDKIDESYFDFLTLYQSVLDEVQKIINE